MREAQLQKDAQCSMWFNQQRNIFQTTLREKLRILATLFQWLYLVGQACPRPSVRQKLWPSFQTETDVGLSEI